MNKRLIVAGLAALTVSCVRETHAINALAVPRAPSAPSVTAWDRQIRNASDAGDGDYQLKALREKTAAEPENIAARLELAKAYRERGYPDVALEVCRLAAARFPESGEAELALVRALHDMNRRQEAAGGLDAFLKGHPQTSPDYYSWLGILRDESGAWPLGEPAHRKAIELAPSQDALHNNLGYNLLMQKKIEEAAGEFRQALRLNPASLVARNNLGLALANLSAEQAIASWQSAANPAVAHNNLAAVWIEKGNYAEARKELNIALSYDKSLPAALKNLALVARLDGNPATVPVPSQATWWERWKTGFKRLFVGSLDEPTSEGVSNGHAAAPVVTTGEER